MGKENRGFASASPQRRKELSKQGSDKALQSEHRHRFTPEQARQASGKGLETRRTNLVKAIIGKREEWPDVITVRDVIYRVHQVPTFPFWLNGVECPAGSWLVWAEDELEVKVMLDTDYQQWRNTAS